MADADDNRTSLGPWTNADLGKTAQANAGIGADTGLPLAVRFTANVAKLVRRRRARDSSHGDPVLPAIFLLNPTPPQLEPGKTTTRVPMLDNGSTPVNGRIWFVGAGPASGHYLDYEPMEDDDLFKMVTERLDQASTPAILFDPRLSVPEARFYPRGLGEPDDYQAISVVPVDVDLDAVLSVVDRVYKSNLVTPLAQPAAGKLWSNQSKWWPSRRAEEIVQLNLTAALAGAFLTCDVRHEQSMPEGRLDIHIEQSDPIDRSKVTRHAVLELKVLRSFHETGTVVTDAYTRDWVESGVNQAFAYRKGAKWSALFCFDMRKEDCGEQCFDHVRDLATRLEVMLKRWFLYAKSSYYRAALAASA
jgi:hypothetical protein